MPRPPRFVIPGLPQHLIVRGNNRDPIFVAEQDYLAYLDWSFTASIKHSCAIHAYVLMTNHVHMLATPSTVQGLGKMVQMIGRYYVQYFNHQYQRTGTLWEGRYKASLVDSERYLLTCQRYIEMNPVRANMVEHPAEYPWSSYQTNAVGKPSKLITPHELYLQLGAAAGERQSAYRALFSHGLSGKIIEEIRDAANKGWALGDPGFLQKIEAMLDRPVQRRAKGGDRKSENYQKCGQINRN
jgi:putative transposase